MTEMQRLSDAPNVERATQHRARQFIAEFDVQGPAGIEDGLASWFAAAFAAGLAKGDANRAALIEALEAAQHFVDEAPKMQKAHLRLARGMVLPIIDAALALVRKGV